jgi:hypothetical protein
MLINLVLGKVFSIWAVPVAVDPVRSILDIVFRAEINLDENSYLFSSMI